MAIVTRRLTEDYVMLDAADGKVLITVSGVCAETVAAYVVTAVNLHAELRDAASEVMTLLEQHGGHIVPHLMDSDQNPGQRLRDALAKVGGRHHG